MTNKFIIQTHARSVSDVAIAKLTNELTQYYPRAALVGLSYETLIALKEYQDIKAQASL